MKTTQQVCMAPSHARRPQLQSGEGWGMSVLMPHGVSAWGLADMGAATREEAEAGLALLGGRGQACISTSAISRHAIVIGDRRGLPDLRRIANPTPLQVAFFQS